MSGGADILVCLCKDLEVEEGVHMEKFFCKKRNAMSGRNRGFTIIEMVVTVALLLILAGIMFQVFYQAKETVRIGNARSNIHNSARGILDVLDKDLSGAIINSDGWAFLGFENTVAGAVSAAGITGTLSTVNNSDTIVFTSSNASYDMAVSRVVFYVLRNDGRLIRAVQTVGTGYLDYSLAVGASEDDYVLAEDVKSINFAYLTNRENRTGGAIPYEDPIDPVWTAAWTSRFGNDLVGGQWYLPPIVGSFSAGEMHDWLPLAVRISLVFNDSSVDPDDRDETGDISFNHIVYLPNSER